MLTPLSFQANLDVWSFHLDNPISHFPPYDTELISEGQLTLSDLDHFHHYVSLREKSPDSDRVPLDPPPEVTSEISLLVKQYTGIAPLTHSSLTRSLIYSLTHSPHSPHPLTHSLTHSLVLHFTIFSYRTVY